MCPRIDRNFWNFSLGRSEGFPCFAEHLLGTPPGGLPGGPPEARRPGGSVAQWRTELERAAYSIGELNATLNAADRARLRTYGDLYTSKRGKTTFVRNSMFMHMQPSEIYSRVTSDVAFMEQNFEKLSLIHI